MAGVRSQQLPRWLDEQGFKAERPVRHGILYRCQFTEETVILARKHTPRGEKNFISSVNRIVRSRPVQKEEVTVNGFKLGDVAKMQQPSPVRRIVEPKPSATPPIASPNKRGNPNITSYSNQPKNWVTPEQRQEITELVLELRESGMGNDDIILEVPKRLPHIRGSQDLPPSKSCIMGCLDRAREIERSVRTKPVKAVKPAPTPKAPKAPAATPTGKLPPFVVGILTEPSLTDSEKVKMLCSYASL